MDHAFYTRFLDRVRKELPGISRNVYVDAAGNPMLHPPLSTYPILREYWLLQHDVLDGHTLLPCLAVPTHRGGGCVWSWLTGPYSVTGLSRRCSVPPFTLAFVCCKRR